MESYLPKTPAQICLTSISAAAVTFVILRSLLKKKQPLKNKVVLITGASSGIGEALAHEFVKAGSKVILAARSIDKLKRIKQELMEMYQRTDEDIATFFLDLEDHSSIPEAGQAIIKLFGRVDILINNAGLACRDKVIRMSMDVYKKVMDINFFGQVALTKELLPSMISNGGGTIAAVSSLQGRFAIPGGSAYGASKHALQAFCDSLRAENVKNKIHVLVISPSYVKTNIALAGITGSGAKPGVPSKDIDAGMSAEYCARQILQSVRCYDDELNIGPFHHRLMVYIRALVPSLYAHIVSRL